MIEIQGRRIVIHDLKGHKRELSSPDQQKAAANPEIYGTICSIEPVSRI
jgi:hypothetical protein